MAKPLAGITNLQFCPEKKVPPFPENLCLKESRPVLFQQCRQPYPLLTHLKPKGNKGHAYFSGNKRIFNKKDRRMASSF